MSAKDIFHEVVKRALQKDGWQITHAPLSLSVGGVNMSIDIAAEREGDRLFPYKKIAPPKLQM
jgi:hypothetical protein